MKQAHPRKRPRRHPSRADYRHRDALHEAGHAVLCLVLHRRLSQVRLDRHGGGVYCAQNPELRLRPGRSKRWWRHQVRREVVIAWAGLIAEEIGTGIRDLSGIEADARLIESLLRRLERRRPDRIALGKHLMRSAHRLVSEHWPAIRCLAAALEQRAGLTRAHCVALIASDPKTRSVRPDVAQPAPRVRQAAA